MKLYSLIIAVLISISSFAQNKGDYYLKLSGGKVSFGSGDIGGYSVLIDASKNVVKKQKFGLDKLLVGAELIFESGSVNPVFVSSTVSEVYSKTFYHVSSTNVWAKASYYPFKKIVSGFNIQIGPTLGYSHRSQEGSTLISVNALGIATRRSTLTFDNGITYGYRISTGLEFAVFKKFLAGMRMDFSNNNEAEINVLLGLKAGIRL